MLIKIIIKELNQVLKKNNKFISDIWLYGSIDDQLSDLDLIFLYNEKPIKIKLSKFLKQKIDDGTIIYIPAYQAKNIFLFEKLNIFSIKHNKKIFKKTSMSLNSLRYLTSFLERYYERRAILLKSRNISPRVFRLIKSTIFSYQNFINFCKYKKIKLKRKNFDFKEYTNIRKKYLSNKFNKKFFNEYLKKFKSEDKNFYKQSIDILDSYFFFNSSCLLNYRFNNYTKYSFKKRKKFIKVPKILAYIYKIYSSQNLSLSKKIKKDFNSDIIISPKYKILNIYLKKKITFLDIAYKDLKKQKFKTGLYRLNWYLN